MNRVGGKSPEEGSSELGAGLKFLGRLFLWAVATNYLWEMLQMPLFAEMEFSDPKSWLICFRASLGDGVIVLTIWVIGFAVFRKTAWAENLDARSIPILLLSGSLIAIGIEWLALEAGRWRYSEIMPLVPLVNVGLIPFLQLLILPWISIRLASR
ncbi:MAG: hypothetical protein RQ801_13635 [Spirochaetaceae bacterium]|nr:hypothetical protein [Spirochaetaceae bacterium]MDT8299341.1 hypothetical protein [Spirochaetaceae bacterium]